MAVKKATEFLIVSSEDHSFMSNTAVSLKGAEQEILDEVADGNWDNVEYKIYNLAKTVIVQSTIEEV